MKTILKTLILLFLFSPFLLYAQNRIVSGEYWFDYSLENKSTLALSPASVVTLSDDIDISTLIRGLHTIHLRFLDDSGRYSPAASAFFIKAADEETSGANSLQKYEYWFDSKENPSSTIDIGNQTLINLNDNLNAAELGYGLHTFSIRFQDKRGIWSPAASSFFIYTKNSGAASDNVLTKFEYWFDSKQSQSATMDIGSQSFFSLNDNLNAAELGYGLHTFSIRFQDEKGIWSPAVSSFFIHSKNNGVVSDNALTEFEYWFDSDISSSIVIQFDASSTIALIEDVDISELSQGLHTIQLRFRDENDLASSVLSRFFIKLPDKLTNAGNNIVAYRYWFDNSEICYKDIAGAQSEIILIDSIDMKLKARGEYILHFQFKDENGLWSSAISDTIEKISFPYAHLSSDQIMACLNDSILFSALLIDADSISWDMGDLGSSSELSFRYAYSVAGDYQVSATIYDTINDLNVSFDLENEIKVYKLPVIDLGENIDLCVGESTSLTGPPGMISYNWSSGVNQESIIVQTEGRYYLVVQDANACINQDSVDVTLRALPVVDIGDTIKMLDTESINVDAGEGFASYLWNDAEGTQIFTVDGSDLGLGEHMLSLEVENEFGCFNSDTVFILVSTLDAVGAEMFTSIRVYPNPVADVLRVDWNNTNFSEIQLTIVNLQGKAIRSEELRGTGLEMDLRALKSGSYFMIISSGNESQTIPLVKL